MKFSTPTSTLIITDVAQERTVEHDRPSTEERSAPLHLRTLKALTEPRWRVVTGPVPDRSQRIVHRTSSPPEQTWFHGLMLSFLVTSLCTVAF